MLCKKKKPQNTGFKIVPLKVCSINTCAVAPTAARTWLLVDENRCKCPFSAFSQTSATFEDSFPLNIPPYIPLYFWPWRLYGQLISIDLDQKVQEYRSSLQKRGFWRVFFIYFFSRDPLLNRRCVRVELDTLERAFVCACYVQVQHFAIVSLGCSPTVERLSTSGWHNKSEFFPPLLDWQTKILPSQLLFQP